MKPNTLDRFVPEFVRHHPRLAGRLAPSWDATSGAVLVADMAGFTALTEQKAREGQAGIEAMQTILNGCFEPIVSIIEAGGGEVYKFAGDATIAWWPTQKGEISRTLHEVTLAAATTALRLHDLMPDLVASLHVPLSLRIGIGAGPLFTAIVGGIQQRWEAVLGGEALQQIASTSAIPSGRVVLSPQAWQVLGADCRGEKRTDGSLVLQHVTYPLGPSFQCAHWMPPRPPEPEQEALVPFIPLHLVQRLVTELPDQMAELRTATVLFATLAAPDHLQAMQRCTETLQRSIYASGGSVLQCLVDDKGVFVLIAAWGIPGSSYPDDVKRALHSAHGLSALLTAQGQPISMGVAHGRLFAGLRGSRSRAEFALIGTVINLAARLAQKVGTTAQAPIFCDAATAQALPLISFMPHPNTALKGIGNVTVFESLGPQGPESAQIMTHAGVLVGRDTEWAHLMQTLQAVVEDPSRSRAVLLEGEAGIGKSHLCQAFAQAVRAQGWLLAMGTSDPLDQASAYRPLRSIFDTLLGLEDETHPSLRHPRVLALLDTPQARERVSLLSTVLDLDLPPSLIDAQMSGRGRMEATTELLVQLLQATHTGSVRVVILEDLNWLDSASYSVLDAALRRCPGLLLLLSARPLLPDDPHAALFEPAVLATRVVLAPLAEVAVRNIIAAELGVTVVPEPVLRAVADKTQGLPLFVRQVVAALVDRRIMHSAAGVLRFDRQALADFTIPDTIQGVVVARIDRLTPHQQSTLKAASVVGRVFSLDALNSLVTQGKPGDRAMDLAGLIDSGLVERTAEPNQFQFSHALVCDAVYSLLPFSQRRALHAALGAWYERHASATRATHVLLARIANHWSQAHDPVRALHALEQAGDHALRTGAYREAQGLFHRLIVLTQQGFGEGSEQPIATDAETSARWSLNLGLSSFNLGELETARIELETSAKLVGYALPGPRRIVLALGLELVQAVVQHWFQSRRHHASAEAVRRLMQTSAVLGTLRRIYNLMQQPAYTMYAIVRRFNLLEPQHSADNPEHVEALGGMMYLSTMAGHYGLADRYANRCLGAQSVRLQHPLAHAEAILPVSLSYLVQTRWELCERTGNEAAQTFQQLGERQSRMVMMSILANAAELQGDFECSAQRYTLVRRLAEEAGDQLSQCWSAGGLAILAIRHGRYHEGAELARRAVILAQACGEAVSYLSDSGLLALSLFEAGHLQAARALVEESVPQIAALPRIPTAHHTLNGLDTFSELILRFWELEAPVRGSAAWLRWARHAALATDRMSGFAKVFAIGAPMAAQRQALQHWLHGRHAKAIKTWQYAIAEGERTRIPFETGKAHLELARHLPTGSPDQRHHALQATTLFQRIGAKGLAERARCLASA
jgi:class 3 adenylate cyclase/tetratricopeptide (TPR) repeat protein